MTAQEIGTAINVILGETIDSDTLSTYILLAQKECAEWEYQLIGIPDDLDNSRYDSIVIDAVVVGISLRGAEGETQHSENGILRGFRYSDMRNYIRNHIIPYARMI